MSNTIQSWKPHSLGSTAPGPLPHSLKTFPTRPRPSVSCTAARRSRGRARSPTRLAELAECEWEGELQPGNDAAKPPPLAVPPAERVEDVSGLEEESLSSHGTGSYWDGLAGRYKLVAATSLAFVICNMDKVNISVAIIPMAQDFGWSPTTAGLVQSSFFYGYLLSQIPGGYASSILGGRRTLPAGVGLWSLATAGVPVFAATLPGLFLSRAVVGLGEGVAPSAATDIVARCIDSTERSRAISFIFAGLHVGSLLGLIIAPAIIDAWGWPSVFYLFGGLGLLWSAWWERLLRDVTKREPELALRLQGVMESNVTSTSANDTADASKNHDASTMGSHGAHGGSIPLDQQVPWRAFVRSRPVQALAYTHFCNNWFHYTMLAWLPTFFTDTLSLSLGSAAKVSILPPIAAIAASAITGPVADALISQGVAIATVRKGAQLAAFLGPSACLVAAAATDDGPATVALIALSLGLASFSLAGLYCNHADLSPRYAPVLLGLTNTSGAIPGIVGVAVTGWLYDSTGSWSMALFVPSIFFFLTGSAVFLAYGSADRQDFSSASRNEPFWFEGPVQRVMSTLSSKNKKK